MNKLGYQPMPVLLRAEPSDARGTSNSAKILRVVATLGGVFALCGVAAICFVAFHASPPKTPETKTSSDPLAMVEAKEPPAAAIDHENGTAAVPIVTDQPRSGTIVDDHSIIDQPAAPTQNPNPISAPVAPPSASVSDSELLKEERPEPGRASLERQLPEPVRKKLEKERRQAERKRARLEEMYRTKTISSEAYKKGEAKYKSEIERYRREMNASRGPKSEVAGQN